MQKVVPLLIGIFVVYYTDLWIRLFVAIPIIPPTRSNLDIANSECCQKTKRQKEKQKYCNFYIHSCRTNNLNLHIRKTLKNFFKVLLYPKKTLQLNVVFVLFPLRGICSEFCISFQNNKFQIEKMFLVKRWFMFEQSHFNFILSLNQIIFPLFARV